MMPDQTLACPSTTDTCSHRITSDQVIEHVIRAAKLLPAQGPIRAFVFLNSLQALEDLPFEEGLRRGNDLFGCETLLQEERYREKMRLGRIRQDDLTEALRRDLGVTNDDPCGPTGTRFDLRLTMLTHEVRMGPVAELRWFVAETDALAHYLAEVTPESRDRCVAATRTWALQDVIGHDHPLKDVCSDLTATVVEQWSPADWTAFSLQMLWEVCQRGAARIPLKQSDGCLPGLRHRNALLQLTGHDSDRRVDELLIPVCASFLDQGLATWEAPNRADGFWKSFVELYGQHPPLESCWQKLSQTIQQFSGKSAAEVIVGCLDKLGVEGEEVAEFLTRELLALRGWAGMIWQGEDRADRMARPMPPGTLVEYMAVRLVLQQVALEWLIRKFADRPITLTELRAEARRQPTGNAAHAPEQRAFQLFQLAQFRGWSAAELSELSPADWVALVDEIDAFSCFHRRRLFQLAFERRFRVRALDALAVHNRGLTTERIAAPKFQSVYCIDTREESFRRHLEEICPTAETFGAAGFYGVAMYFKGVADAHFQALCPIVVRPKHWVTEEVVYSLAESDRRRAGVRKRLATASHQFHIGSRRLTSGAFLTASLGVFASIPLVARVLFPRTTSRFNRALGSVVQPPPVTRLRLERIAENPGKEGDALGYSIPEMADVGTRILSEIGLRTGFARLVFFFGHGSFCLNNPHKSAYDCGACSGSAGGPNARALAAMLNDSRVRAILAERNIVIPNDTVFVGGLHNTATDSFSFYDLDLLPRSHIADFESARDRLEMACERNAQERCRRFYSAPLTISPDDARRHVENRTEDLAQTRPEFGNASNAMCVVGRRARTRGLYLDRRSFLVSYDPTIDDAEATILGRILGAVVIVCSGINLQYYFSYVDSPGWGAGTKLPHNITSLLGVMDGAPSDLRSGLPWQGVEIHEPLRLLMIIETTPAAIEMIMDRNPGVGNILRNGWMQLALIDPQTGTICVYQDGTYRPYDASVDQLPRAATSAEWFRGWREHLEFAEIDKSAPNNSP